MAIKEKCIFRMKLVSNDNEQNKIIEEFESEFDTKKDECAVLIVHSTSAPEKWTIAGFDDEKLFRRLLIDDPNSELSIEIQKGPLNKNKIIELVTAQIGITLKKKQCFVISPIGQENSTIRNHANDVLRFIIEPAMQKYGIEAVRSDHIYEAGDISDQMFREIFTADICIAILTDLNPNVFYELAVAQCAARPLIILMEVGQTLPFDIKDLRIIYYDTSSISRLVDGYYADRVIEQLKDFENKGWVVPSLFEQFGPTPRLKTEQQVRQFIKNARPKPLPAGRDKTYILPADKGKEQQIEIITGDFTKLKSPNFSFDVVVSLENTYMQLGHYFDLSFSGKLRYLDAKKDDGSIIKDSLNESLHKQLENINKPFPMALASLIASPTCELQKDYGIKRVFHIAALDGSVGEGYTMMDGLIDDCVRNVFKKFKKLANSDDLKTIMIPMLGAFSTQLEHLEVARNILNPVVFNLRQTPSCQKVYLLAWVESQRFALQQIAKEMDLMES